MVCILKKGLNNFTLTLIYSDDCGFSCDSDSDSDIDENDSCNNAFQELQMKKSHPWRLHDELWYNDQGEVSIIFCCGL